MARATAAVVGVLLLSLSASASAQSLRGSRATMREQNAVARNHDYSFLRTSSQVERFVDLGLLVELPGNAHYELARVSFPYARPGVKTFVERLARQYQAACGEKLVVTSLTRPEARQPGNASELSVHPAGMAVDLRVSHRASCRQWLESTLLSLEKRDVIDVTRERHPPHYHVAVFPTPYERYVAALTDRGSTRLAKAEAEPDVRSEPAATTAVAVADPPRSYEVRPGDTLWGIARRFGLTVDALKASNQLATARIMAGQKLAIAEVQTPMQSGAAADAAATVVAAASVPAAGGPSEPVPAAAPEKTLVEYEVRRGDTLWDIARRHGITVEQLKSMNNLASARIKAGQTLALPSP